MLALFVTHLVTVLFTGAVALFALRKNRQDGDALLLLAVALLSLPLTPLASQRLDLSHFLLAGTVSLSLFPCSLAFWMDRNRGTRDGRAVLAALLGMIAGIETLAPGLTFAIRDAFAKGLTSPASDILFLEKDGRSFPFSQPEMARRVNQLLLKLESVSKADDRLFVGPGDLRRTNYCDAFIYHFCPKLRPASYFIEMNPFSANRPNSRLAADIASADWLVLDRSWDAWDEPNRSAEYGPDVPNEIVRTEFIIVQAYGPFALFQRRHR